MTERRTNNSQSPAFGKPRRLKDRAVGLPEFTALFNATVHATLPCEGGTEWTSDDVLLQRRAAALCRSCLILDVCRAFALASGVKGGTWGGLTPAARKRMRRKEAA